MKKFLLFAGLAATALSFVGCNKEADVRGLGKKTAELILTTVDTRTVNDGMNTKWEADDALTVFYAPAGTSEYSANTQFTITDAESGLAKGEVELTADSYDWYLLYPYTAQITDPTTPTGDDGKRRGYLYFGCGSKQSQTQAGLDNMDHVRGIDLPMVGLAKGVSASETPQVAMKHLTSLVKINVTNVYEKSITITGLSFTAPEDIIGTYYVDFSGNEVKIDPSGDNYVSKTAKLTVEGAAPLASGKTASFYIPIKPFEASSGDLLTVDITAEEGTCKAEMNATKAYSFEAGHIKTLNVEFEKAEQASSVSISEMMSMADGEAVTSNEVLVVAKASTGVLVKEGSDYILVYDKSALADIKVGDKVVVKGTIGSYSGAKQITSPKVTVNSSNNTVTHPTATDVTDSFETYSASYAEAVSFTGTLKVSGNYYNINVGEITSRIGSILAPATEDADAVKALNGKNVQVTGYYLYIASNKYFYVIATEVKEADPGTTETETAISLPYNASVYVGETYSLNATANVDAAIAYESEDVTIATVDANGVVTGVAEGTVKIYARITGVSGQYTSDEKYCNVTVLKKTQEGDGTVVFDQEFLAANKDGSKDVISYTNSTDYGNTSVTELRIYKGKDFVVSASDNHKITSIKITCTAEGTNKQGPGCFGAGAPEGYTYEGKIGTWTGSASSVSFKATDNQVRIIEMVVTYE